MNLDNIKSLEKPYADLGMKIARNNVLCPAHGGNTATLHRHDQTGHLVWKCFSCGEGGTIIDAYKLKHDLDIGETLKQLLEKYGNQPVQFRQPKRKTASFERNVNIEITSQKIDPPTEGWINHDGEKLYIKDAKIWKQECLVNGVLCAAASLRWDPENGKKVMRQAHFDGKKWVWKGFPWLPIPLLNEHMFDKAERICFVEGEKCKDKLEENIDVEDVTGDEDYPLTVVTTNFGGSNAIRKANLKALRGKEVFYFRDNDEPGLKCMEYAKSQADGKIVNPADMNPSAPEGYDVYDYLADGYPTAALFQLSEDGQSFTMEDVQREVGQVTNASEMVQLFEKIVDNDISPSHSEMDVIFDRLKTQLSISKSAVKNDWKEISSRMKSKDWPDLVMRHVYEKYYCGNLIYTGKMFWAYNGKHWYVSEMIGNKIYQAADYIIKPGVFDKTTACTKAEQLLTRFTAREHTWLGLNTPPKPIINVNNGELHLQEDGSVVLRDHNPDSRVTYCLETSYNPQAQCPLYDRAIRDIMCGDEDLVRHFEEVCGYMIQPVRFSKNFFIFWGPKGNNGKTTLTTLIKALIGSGTVLSRKIHDFGNDTHDTYQLVGKMLLVDDDMEKGVTLNDGLLKEISELKELTANPKNKDTFPFLSYAAVLICCNNLPRTNDLTQAMRSRANFIPFYRRFTEEEADETLFKRIHEEEMSGVLNRFLEGYKRLIQRGKRWDYPEKVIQAKDSWLTYTSSIYDFMTSHFTEGGEEVTARDLRAKYENWCNDQGIDGKYRIQSRHIKTSLEDLGYNIEGANNNQGGWKIVGVLPVE